MKYHNINCTINLLWYNSAGNLFLPYGVYEINSSLIILFESMSLECNILTLTRSRNPKSEYLQKNIFFAKLNGKGFHTHKQSISFSKYHKKTLFQLEFHCKSRLSFLLKGKEISVCRKFILDTVCCCDPVQKVIFHLNHQSKHY